MLHKTKQPRQTTEHTFSDRKRRIYDFLHSNPIGVLSSITSNGDPHGSVIYFRIDQDFTVSFLTKVETRKYDNLKHHEHVTLTVFEPQTQTTAQVMGTAQEIVDSYEINAIAGTILATSLKTSDAGMPPISKLEAGKYVAFRITPINIRIAVYSRPDRGENSDIFESIESFELHERET